MKNRLLISFSGGETSALMTKIIMDRMAGRYDQIVTVFANTGEENNATLTFVEQCDARWGWGVVWVEADVQERHGAGTRAKVVNFATASRMGQPFERVIEKYGIPNKAFPHCTRELKERPINAYARDVLGWAAGSYDTAIGIRVDEIDRMNPKARERRLIYPLVKPFPRRKEDVNQFWASQPFRLGLKGYQGNCKWCWKKSLRKHATIMSETPQAYLFPERMEALHPFTGAGATGEPRRFFRGNKTVADIRALAASGAFQPAGDDSVNYQSELDLGEGCEESCEVNFGDAA